MEASFSAGCCDAGGQVAVESPAWTPGNCKEGQLGEDVLRVERYTWSGCADTTHPCLAYSAIGPRRTLMLGSRVSWASGEAPGQAEWYKVPPLPSPTFHHPNVG